MVARVGCALLNVNHVLQRYSVEIACYVIKLINPKIIISYGSLDSVVHTYKSHLDAYVRTSIWICSSRHEIPQLKTAEFREGGRKDGVN